MSFYTPTLHLQPLTMGIGYQWTLSFTSPLNLIMRHNQYVLVMIEHFSKWLKLMSLSNHNNEGATYGFMEKILNRFGFSTTILIKQGMKLCEELSKNCVKSYKNCVKTH
jgi:hypothetical protein